MDKISLLNRLQKLDMEAKVLFPGPEKFKMIIAGGSGLVLLDAARRVTSDIDVISLYPMQLFTLFEANDINTHVKAFMCNFPYNYEDRIERLPVGGEKIEFFAVSVEDLVISKLCSNRDSDRQDLLTPEMLSKIDWEKLESIVMDPEELEPNMLNRRQYLDFMWDYEQYVGRYRPK